MNSIIIKAQLKDYFDRYVTFSDHEFDQIYAKLSFKTLSKKDYLLKEGQVCTYKYFILNGLVRLFYNDHKGNEKITQFAIENWWVSSMESFVKGTPSTLSIQALETSQILYIDKKTLEELYLTTPKLERLFRIITENMLIAIQRRHDIYLQLRSKDRYDGFIKLFPNFIQRVPQYMIASYLDITPEYLSELRKIKGNLFLKIS